MSQSKPKPERLTAGSALKPILFSLLILISGVIIGAGTTLMVMSKQKPRPSGRMLERIARELDLSPEQRKQIDPILQKHRKAMDDLFKESRPKINVIFDQMDSAIMAVLDENQQQIWKEKIKEREDRFNRMGQHRGRGGGRRDGTGPRGPGRGGRRHEGPPPGGMPPLKEAPAEDAPIPQDTQPGE